MEMSDSSKVTKYIKKEYVILTKEEAKAVLARLKQADLLLKLASKEKRWNLWT
jgi:hypothetical protein